MSHAFPTLAVLATLAAPALAGDVHVVDAFGGGDFSEIQPAVQTAADGDTILVESGIYQAVVVTHKGLAIVADEGADVRVVGGVRVEDTLVIHEVVLAGMKLDGSNAPGAQRAALVLSVTRGPVRVEDCELRGADGFDHADPELGADGVEIQFGLDVSFVGCTLSGGMGGESFSGFDANRGGDGMQVTSSSLAVDDCEILGGDGGEGDFFLCDFGGNAGHGARITDSLFFAAGSRLYGGDGGGDDFLACQPGGHGAFLSGSGTTGHFLADDLQGGLGACGAPDGRPVAVSGGAATNFLPGSARKLASPTPARELALVTLTFEGVPGESAFVLVSLTPGFELVLPFSGVLLLQLPLAQGRRFMGTIPATGTLVKTLTLPALPPGAESAHFFLQSLFVTASGGVRLGSPSNLVLLDSGF